MSWNFEDYEFNSATMYIDERGYPRFKHNNKLVHREVAAQKLGGMIEPHKVVHHKNKDKMDFHPSNLQTLERNDHNFLHGKYYPYALQDAILAIAIMALILGSIYANSINANFGVCCCPISIILIGAIFYHVRNSKKHVFEAEWVLLILGGVVGFVLNTIPKWLSEKKWSIIGWAVILFAYEMFLTISRSTPSSISFGEYALMMAVGAIIVSFVLHALWAIANGIFKGFVWALNGHPIKKDKEAK